MRRRLVCAAVALALGVAAPVPAQVLDALVARVDTEAITWSQVVQEIALRRREGGAEQQLTPEAVRQALVERHLLAAEAEKLRLEVDADGARREVAALEAAGGPGFWAAMARLGIDRALLEERAARRQLVASYRALRREMTFVPETEVRSYFYRHRDVAAGRSLAEVRDELRARLAEEKFRRELTGWLKRQVAEGRVEWLPLPEGVTPP